MNVEALSLARAKGVAQSIKTAAARTGSDFAYLLKASCLESGLNPNARASTSSATGIFQFTDQTWLRLVKEHGAKYGLGNYADQIRTDSNGSPYVANAEVKQAILALRKDPQKSAEMKCELDKANAEALRKNVGGAIGPTELHLAHFLGAGGATRLLSMLRENPSAMAASLLPAAAKANPSIFYDAQGDSRSVSQIYSHFAEQFGLQGSDPSAASPASLLAGVAAAPQLATSSIVASAQNADWMAAATSNPTSMAAMMMSELNMMNAITALTSDSDEEDSMSILA